MDKSVDYRTINTDMDIAEIFILSDPHKLKFHYRIQGFYKRKKDRRR